MEWTILLYDSSKLSQSREFREKFRTLFFKYYFWILFYFHVSQFNLNFIFKFYQRINCNKSYFKLDMISNSRFIKLNICNLGVLK